MAVTTTYPDPPPEDHVELPWHPQRHPVTRLDRRSAAVATWLDTVRPDRIVEIGGDVPPKHMHRILVRLSHPGS